MFSVIYLVVLVYLFVYFSMFACFELVSVCLFQFVSVRLLVFCCSFVCLFELVLCGLCVIISDDSGGNASLL